MSRTKRGAAKRGLALLHGAVAIDLPSSFPNNNNNNTPSAPSLLHRGISLARSFHLMIVVVVVVASSSLPPIHWVLRGVQCVSPQCGSDQSSFLRGAPPLDRSSGAHMQTDDRPIFPQLNTPPSSLPAIFPASPFTVGCRLHMWRAVRYQKQTWLGALGSSAGELGGRLGSGGLIYHVI